jgi:hypothetical protein
MPTMTYTPLATVTLASAAATVTLTNIPATYRDLILVINGGYSTGSGNFLIALNSDTTNANYSMVAMFANGGGGSAVGSGNGTRYLNYYGFPSADLNTVIVTQIMDYSATDKHKTFLTRSNNAGNGTTALANRWANTAAVTSVQVIGESQNIRAGSTISLYGVIA